VTTYRVGPEGATVFDADGSVATDLRPGQVVVPGSTEISGSLAAQYNDLQQKRRKGYADKRLRVAEDKGAG
jgi:hypothetical protein